MAPATKQKKEKQKKENDRWSEVDGDFNEKARIALDARKGEEARLANAAALSAEHPGSPLAHHIHGHVLAALGNAGDALPCLLRAAELAPTCLEIAFTLAHAHTKAEQFGLAAKVCRRALGVVEPADPKFYTVTHRRLMDDTKTQLSTRVAAATERLLGFLTAALAAMARQRLNSMSDEELRSFLTVRVEDLQAYFHNQEEWLAVLVDATKLAMRTKAEAWFYFLCPECNMVILKDGDFQWHIEEEHTQELKSLVSSDDSGVPNSLTDDQIVFLQSWVSPKPADIPLESEAEGNEIVRKIKDAILHLNDRKALPVKIVEKLVEFTKGWLGKSAAVPKDLSCIASLDHAGLQVVGIYLERLQTSSGDNPHERACGDENDSPDVVGLVIQIRDASVISVDIDKIVSVSDVGPSNADVIFNWLCLKEEQLPSRASKREDCIAKGTEVLDKLDKMKDLLKNQANLKSDLRRMNEDYFRTEASIDVEISQLKDEVECLKRKLEKACRFDYLALILPVFKAYLWHQLSKESPEKGLQQVGGKVDEKTVMNTDDSRIQNNSDVVSEGDIDAAVNNGSPGKGINDVDDTGSSVSKSGQQIELLPTAKEQNNLGDAIAEQAYMASDSSASTKGIKNNLTVERNRTAYPNSDNELQSLNVTLRSLWHLRHFSDRYMDIAPTMPHVGVSGDRCLVCLLFELFYAWDNKDDIRPNFVLRYMRTVFRKILDKAKVSQKEETTMAVITTNIIFTMIHKSQTLLRSSHDTGEVEYKTVHSYLCPDSKCIAHRLFGMCKKEEKEYTCFFNLDASELLNIGMNSFSEVIKSVNKQFYCGTESCDCNGLPHFFTIVFGQPADKESNLDVSRLLISIAAPLDISHFFEALQSECKYTVLSAVFHVDDRDISFAREQDKWRIYDGSTIKDADSWENALDGYKQSRLYPQIIFFEKHSTTAD